MEQMKCGPRPSKIALIDADTIVFAVCSVFEYADDLLAQNMYSEDEWNVLTSNKNYDSAESCIWTINHDEALEACINKVATMLSDTFTVNAELYFTAGKNFRHQVDPMYKANRKSSRYPVGMPELKAALLEIYPGVIGDGVEADDMVVYLKRTQPDKYVLCAVDKDVYKSVPGKHWNYYSSAKYNIAPKWVETTLESAKLFPYIQTLMGDSTDNIRGCPGIGPKKAEKALVGCDTAEERWNAVVKLFKEKKLTVKDAVRDMRLVNMHQVVQSEDGSWAWEPWTQPMGD